MRVARHTKDLKPIIKFYTEILGLKVLGEFKNHNNYDGIFLGLENLDWHLEFTVSDDKPKHIPDEDDLLVFYLNSVDEYNQLKKKFSDNSIKEIKAKNPYWNENGTTYLDPDKFRIVLSVMK